MPLVDAGVVSITKRMHTGEYVLDLLPSMTNDQPLRLNTPRVEDALLSVALRKLANRVEQVENVAFTGKGSE